MKSLTTPTIILPLQEFTKGVEMEEVPQFLSGRRPWNFMKRAIEERPEYRSLHGPISHSIGCYFLVDALTFTNTEKYRDRIRFSLDVLLEDAEE